MCEYLPELHNSAAVDTWTAASASVGEAYAAVAASGGFAAWPDTAKRDDQEEAQRHVKYSSYTAMN